MAVTVCVGTPGLGLSKPLETKYMTPARAVHGYTSLKPVFDERHLVKGSEPHVE